MTPDDLAALTVDLVRSRRRDAELVDALVEALADLTFENQALRLLIGRLNKGVRVERDALRAELERFTSSIVSDGC